MRATGDHSTQCEFKAEIKVAETTNAFREI